MEFKMALRGIGAQFLQMLAVRGGVELCGDHNHGFLGQLRAEGGELVLDDFEVLYRVAIVGVARIHQMRDEARALDVFQEARTEPGAFMRALDESGKVGDDKSAAVTRRSIRISRDHAEVRLESGERIRRD